jgi:hypothetical protein
LNKELEEREEKKDDNTNRFVENCLEVRVSVLWA